MKTFFVKVALPSKALKSLEFQATKLYNYLNYHFIRLWVQVYAHLLYSLLMD